MRKDALNSGCENYTCLVSKQVWHSLESWMVHFGLMNHFGSKLYTDCFRLLFSFWEKQKAQKYTVICCFSWFRVPGSFDLDWSSRSTPVCSQACTAGLLVVLWIQSGPDWRTSQCVLVCSQTANTLRFPCVTCGESGNEKVISGGRRSFC